MAAYVQPDYGTLLDGLVSSYTSGGTDLFGANNLTPSATPPTTAVGKVSPLCMSFDKATDQHFILPDADAADFEPNQNFTVAAWYFTGTMDSSGHGIWGKYPSSGVGSYMFVNGSRTITWRVKDWIATQAVSGTTVWRQAVMTWENTTGTGGRGLSGNQGFVEFSPFAAAVNNAGDFYLGSLNSPTASTWDGQIDQFCRWNRILNAHEIMLLYNDDDGYDFLTEL